MFKIEVKGDGEWPTEVNEKTTKVTATHNGMAVDLTKCISTIKIDLEAFKHATAQICLYPEHILIENPKVTLTALSNNHQEILGNLSGMILQYETGREVHLSATGEITCKEK